MFLFVSLENIDKQRTMHGIEGTQYNILNWNLNREKSVGNDFAIVV